MRPSEVSPRKPPAQMWHRASVPVGHCRHPHRLGQGVSVWSALQTRASPWEVREQEPDVYKGVAVTGRLGDSPGSFSAPAGGREGMCDSLGPCPQGRTGNMPQPAASHRGQRRTTERLFYAPPQGLSKQLRETWSPAGPPRAMKSPGQRAEGRAGKPMRLSSVCSGLALGSLLLPCCHGAPNLSPDQSTHLERDPGVPGP